MEADHTMDGWARLTDVGVLLLDRNRGLGCASPHACRLLGCASHAELQSQWPSLLPRLLFAQVDRLQGDSGSHCLTFDLEMSDRVQPLRAEVCPTEDGYLVLIKDRTHISPCEAHLVRSSRVDVLQFLSSTIVHDLSAPLHNLQLTASLLQAAATDGEGAQGIELQQRCQRYAGMLQQEVVKLRALTQALPDHLAWPRTISPHDLDIRPLIEEVARSIRHEATARRISRSVSLPSDPLMVHGEERMLRLALLDVLIALMAACEIGAGLRIEARANGARAEIIVRADNCKLPQQVVDDIHSVSLAASAQHAGLAAARLIIESNHGDFTATREPDAAVRFHLSLPVGAGAALSAK